MMRRLFDIREYSMLNAAGTTIAHRSRMILTTRQFTLLKIVFYLVSVCIIGTLLSLLMTVLAAAPWMSYTSKSETFSVRFEQGAIWACVYFQEQRIREEARVNFPDGRYKPHKCGGLDLTSTIVEVDWEYIRAEDSDWLVWAEIGYEQKDGTVAYTASNQLRVHR
jgi:hypothetical protein